MSLDQVEGKVQQDKALRKTAIWLALFVAFMVGMAYAAVPLYEAFCRVTGFGGTTQRVAENDSEVILDRVVKVRFDANISKKLDWEFGPADPSVDVQIGENRIVHYVAKNNTNKDLKGRAVFNVTPDVAGQYFNKIECFCFTEQTLNPNQEVYMPIEFYVDPDFDKDPDLEHVKVITLSYTFYPMDEE